MRKTHRSVKRRSSFRSRRNMVATGASLRKEAQRILNSRQIRLKGYVK